MDTTANLAPAMKYNYGSQIINKVAAGRKQAKVGTPTMARQPRPAQQQNGDRVRDALRLKPWL